MYIILFILVLFVLVLVHEWGHFIVAKKTGMRVDEFGIGFPPRLWGKQKGETLYSLNALPIGGFVKIYGEDGDDASIDPDRMRAFGNRPFWAQAAVLVAGVSMNILLAWALLSLAFTIGVKQIVDEATASPSAELRILSVLPHSPASDAGIRAGDKILSVVNENGHPLETLKPSTISDFIQDYDHVTLTYSRNGTEESKVLHTKRGLSPDALERRVVGISTGLLDIEKRPIHKAIYDAGIFTLHNIRDTIVGISTLIGQAVFFKADLTNVAGPIGIAGFVGDAAAFGVSSVLMFMAFISINLAVINLLPFPALDGGRLVFSAIEAVKGSPLPKRAAQMVNTVGFAFLMVLIVAVSVHDVLKMF